MHIKCFRIIILMDILSFKLWLKNRIKPIKVDIMFQSLIFNFRNGIRPKFQRIRKPRERSRKPNWKNRKNRSVLTPRSSCCLLRCVTSRRRRWCMSRSPWRRPPPSRCFAALSWSSLGSWASSSWRRSSSGFDGSACSSSWQAWSSSAFLIFFK